MRDHRDAWEVAWSHGRVFRATDLTWLPPVIDGDRATCTQRLRQGLIDGEIVHALARADETWRLVRCAVRRDGRPEIDVTQRVLRVPPEVIRLEELATAP